MPSVTGTTAAPLVSGTAHLSKGDVTDYTLGAHVNDLAATIEATGDTIRLTQFSGKAGPGTLGGNGSISLAGTMPVDLHFTADNARPLSSDLMTALIDANLTVQGDVKGDLQAGGTLHVRRADIRIPDKLPASVAVLPVRNANTPPPPAAGSRTTIDDRAEPDGQRAATGLHPRPRPQRGAWRHHPHPRDRDETDPGWRLSVAPRDAQHHRHDTELHRRIDRFQRWGPYRSLDPFRGDIDAPRRSSRR